MTRSYPLLLLLLLSGCTGLFGAKKYVRLHYVEAGDTLSGNTRGAIPPLPDRRVAAVIDIRDLKFTDNALDHIAVTYADGRRVKHYSSHVWDELPMESITRMLRERFRTLADTFGYAIALQRSPVPTHVLLGDVQEFIVLGDEDGCPVRARLVMRMALYAMDDATRSNILSQKVFTYELALPAAKLKHVASGMSIATSRVVDEIVVAVVGVLPAR